MEPSYGIRRAAAAAAVCTLWLGGGCGQDNAWTAAWDKSCRDPIQRQVETKISAQSKTADPNQRWEDHKADEYQTPQTEESDSARLEIERQREEAARGLIAKGPLSLVDCLAYGLVFNDEVRAARATVRSMGGEELIAKSRFLPRVTLDLSSPSLIDTVRENLRIGVRGAQTLLEIGKDNPIDVSLRSEQRSALFQYEGVVSRVLADVRLRFYTILLRKQQLEIRRQLMRDFSARWKRMQALEEARRVREADVLTAKLNVLNEDLRINLLEKDILRDKMDLLKAVGFPVRLTEADVSGEQEAFDVPLEEAVAIALRRSTEIAQARATVYEQDRVVRQIIWEYLPSVEMAGGYSNKRFMAGGAVNTNDRLYSTDGGIERLLRRGDGGFNSDGELVGPGTPGWHLDMVMELPIFSGLERTGTFRREKALLDRSRDLLGNTVARTELDVRKAFQTVREQEMSTNILRETVQISKKRLEVQEKLKELGKISDDQLETFRERFFNDQDSYFSGQSGLVQAQESLRAAMRYFEPIRKEGAER